MLNNNQSNVTSYPAKLCRIVFFVSYVGMCCSRFHLNGFGFKSFVKTKGAKYNFKIIIHWLYCDSHSVVWQSYISIVWQMWFLSYLH